MNATDLSKSDEVVLNLPSTAKRETLIACQAKDCPPSEAAVDLLVSSIRQALLNPETYQIARIMPLEPGATG